MQHGMSAPFDTRRAAVYLEGVNKRRVERGFHWRLKKIFVFLGEIQLKVSCFSFVFAQF